MANNITHLVHKTKLGNATAKSVLILLAEFSNPEGFSFPAIAYIADCTEISQRQVYRVIQILDEIGLVTHHKVSIPSRYKQAFQINLSMLESDLKVVFREAFIKAQGKPDTVSETIDCVSETLDFVSETIDCVSETQNTVSETQKSVSETNPPDPLIGGTTIEPPENHQEPPTRAATSTAARGLSLVPVAPGSLLKPEELIYAAYPRREGRRVALKAIEAAVLRLRHGTDGSPPMELREAQKYLWDRALAYADSPAGQRSDKTLIPHPATWFNQARYQDDEENWQLPGANGGMHGTPANRAQQRDESNLAAIERFAQRRGVDLHGTGEAGGGSSGVERPGRCGPGDLFTEIIRPLSPG